MVDLYQELKSTEDRTLKSLRAALLASLEKRFSGLLNLLMLTHKSGEGFSSNVYVTATGLDPNYAFLWLKNLPLSKTKRKTLRKKIEGKTWHKCAWES